VGLQVAELFGTVSLDASKFDRTLDASRSKMQTFGSKMKSIGDKATLGLTLPILGLFKVAADGAKEAAQGQAKLGAVLKATKEAAHLNVKEMNELAQSLAETTLFEDDAVTGAETILATFKKVRDEVGKGNDVYSRAIRDIADMSTVLEMDLSSAATLAGKALNDPAKGAAALGRSGAIAKSDVEKLNRMVANGVPILEQQKFILKKLEEQYKGAAAAAANTDWGKAQQGWKAMGEALEALGAALAPIVVLVSQVITPLANGFIALPPILQGVTAGFLGLLAAVGPVMSIGGRLIENWHVLMGLGPKLASALETLQIAGMLSAASLKTAWISAMAGIRAAVSASVAFLMANPWVAAIAAAIAITVIIIKNWDKVKAVLLGIWETLKSAAKTLWDGLTAIVRVAVAAIKAYINTLIAPIKWAMDAVGWLEQHTGGGAAEFVNQVKGFAEEQGLKVPQAAMGAVVRKESIVRVAENGPEAIVPLNGKSGRTAMRNVGGGNTLVADLRGANIVGQGGMTELARILKRVGGFDEVKIRGAGA
jgi:hypothetical protein